MKIELLKQKILDLAIRGKLVPQDPNDEPASILIQKIKTERDKLVKEKKIKKPKEDSYIYKGDDNHYYENVNGKTSCIDDEIPFEIPDSWCWCRLGNICNIQNGFTPQRNNLNFWNNGNIPWFTIEDKHNQGLYINYTKQHITNEACSKDRIVPSNSVLLCCTASVGEIAFTNIPLTTNQQFNGISVKEKYKDLILSKYILIFCMNLKKLLNKTLATATTFGFVSVSKVKQILLPLPPTCEQYRIISATKNLINKIEILISGKNNLTLLVNNLKYKILDSIFSDNSRYKSYYENTIKLGDILIYEQPAKYIVSSTDYNDKYKTPVLTPGKTFILGYTNETEGIYKVDNEPIIIFDDFTTASRLIDFDFKVKSSAMKILTNSNPNRYDMKYMYYLLQTIHINNNTHKRYWISNYALKQFKIHKYEEQIKIVNYIENIYSLIDKIVG